MWQWVVEHAFGLFESVCIGIIGAVLITAALEK